MKEKMRSGVIQHASNGSIRASHNALHAVNRAQIVAAVDAVGAAGSDQNILVVIGHADHFMWDDLANRENEIELSASDEPVYLGRPVIIEAPFRLFADEIAGNNSDGFHILAPLMNMEEGAGHIAEH